MTGGEFEIICDIVRDQDVIEEAVRRRSYRHARVDANRFEADQTAQGPSVQILLALCCKVSNVCADVAVHTGEIVNNVSPVPVRVVGVGP